ncbi:MAG TPA: IscS subfamily cysteine desulfurase [Candidatus Binatia bacterium]|jgi:cysteine desulfurase|nr:IscS subfamily cysteine desulfurase [Candidatus Binatia bacterium]
MTTRGIYMDNHATTPVDPRVLEAMLPYFNEIYGNAASRTHGFGWVAEKAVDAGREQVARLINARAKDIVFTSGATEADNLAIKGVVEFYKDKGNHVITQVTEHKAVLDTCRTLERKGLATVTYLPVDKFGRIDLDQLRDAITDKTVLVSIMYANNEIGTIQPLAEIGKITRERGVLFHSDAVQGMGKLPLDVETMNIDLLSLTAHKIYGPKGIGALYVRSKGPRVRLTPMIDGGGHERGMRSGTLNVPGIVGLGAACELSRESMADESQRILGLRERLHEAITSQLDEVYLNGHPVHRLPGNLNLSFAFVEGESLLMGLNGSVHPIAAAASMAPIAVSSGSACTSATLEPSYVLKALGVGEDLAHTSIRFGLGRFNTVEDVDYVAERVVNEVRRLRDLSPLYEMAKEGIDLKTVAWQRD